MSSVECERLTTIRLLALHLYRQSPRCLFSYSHGMWGMGAAIMCHYLEPAGRSVVEESAAPLRSSCEEQTATARGQR
jgi:hypothetical protein